MKQSTCRYFQRENELPLRWKSTRREATSDGACRLCADAPPSDSASDAIATPCGSCAWMTSGASRLTTREQLPRRRQIHLGPRRQRDQLEPFGRAPPQLAVRVRDERRALADRPQAVHGQQHLVLTAAPGARGVDVKREHRPVQGSRLGVRDSGFAENEP